MWLMMPSVCGGRAGPRMWRAAAVGGLRRFVAGMPRVSRLEVWQGPHVGDRPRGGNPALVPRGALGRHSWSHVTEACRAHRLLLLGRERLDTVATGNHLHVGAGRAAPVDGGEHKAVTCGVQQCDREGKLACHLLERVIMYDADIPDGTWVYCARPFELVPDELGVLRGDPFG